MAMIGGSGFLGNDGLGDVDFEEYYRRPHNDETTWAQMIEERDKQETKMHDLTKELAALDAAMKQAQSVSDEMGRTITRQHNEIVEKDKQIALLKEQIRVADVSYQHLFNEHTSAQCEIKDLQEELRRLRCDL